MLVLLIAINLKLHIVNGVSLHDVGTKFHENSSVGVETKISTDTRT